MSGMARGGKRAGVVLHVIKGGIDRKEEGKMRERRRIVMGKERERERDCQTHRQSVRAEDGQGRSEKGASI